MNYPLSHVLVVFGGANGIEAAIEADEKLKANKMEQIFDMVCEAANTEPPAFGTRSVRMEVSLFFCSGFVYFSFLFFQHFINK